MNLIKYTYHETEIVRGGRFRPRPHADGLTGEIREMQEKGTPAEQSLFLYSFHTFISSVSCMAIILMSRNLSEPHLL